MSPGRLLGLVVAGALLVPVAAPAEAQTTPDPATAPEQTALADAGAGETTLRGTYGSADFFVPLPAGAVPDGDTVLEVQYTASPLLTDESTLTMSAGGTSVASARLGPDAKGRQRLRAVVPAALVGAEGLALTVQGFLRLTDDPCEETTNAAKWVVVHPESSVRLGTVAGSRNLRNAAELLVGSPLPPEGTTIVLPEQPDAEVLRAAGTAAVQIGRWHAEQRTDPVVSAASTVPVGRPSVVVAAGRDLPTGAALRWAGPGLALGSSPVEGARGVLAMASPPGRSLVLSGDDPEAVVAAATALADPALRSALAGPVMSLTGVTPAGLPERTPPWQDSAASLAQLGIGRLDVTGLGVRELSFSLDRPAAWTLREEGELALVVDASARLQRGGSTVQVLVNGTDLGSRRLTPGGGPRTYDFDLPAALLDRGLDGRPVRTLDLVVRFVLAADQQECEPLETAGLRATLLPTSAFRLPHDEYDGRELARFPHPVADEHGLLVVLPADPDQDELAAGLQLAAAYGRWAEPSSGPLELTTSDALPDGAAGRGLVLLGDAADEVGEPLDLGRGPVDLPASSARAVIGLGRSPLGEDRTALVVAADGPGLVLAARALSSRAILTSLRGSRVALAGSATPASLAGSDGAVPPVALAPVVGGSWYEEVRPWTVPALVLLVALLVLLAVVARYRWRVRPTP